MKYFIVLLALMISASEALCAKSSARPIIYITSDDGPLEGTENVISVMTEEQVPVTMFMVGCHYDQGAIYKHFVAMAKKSSFVQIANHSYSHAGDHYRHFYHDTKEVVADLKKNNVVLGLATYPTYARLPGRDVFRIPGFSRDDPYISRTEDQIETVDDDAVHKGGFFIYGWDVEWAHDLHGKPIQSPEEMVEHIERKFAHNETALPNQLILLMHDEMFHSAFDGKAQLKKLIALLKQKNYEFDFIQNYRLGRRN